MTAMLRTLLTAVALVSAFLAPLTAADCLPAGTQLQEFDWFTSLSGVAVDSAGNLYVSDPSYARVAVLSPDGTLLYNITADFDGPTGVAVRGEYVYVTDYFNHRVVVLSLNGTLLHSFWADGLEYPYAIAADSARIYVVDPQTRRLVVLSSNGTLLWSYTDSTLFPLAVAVDASGNVYVTSSASTRVW